eukprot:1527220-Amphidinium_carterae.1
MTCQVWPSQLTAHLSTPLLLCHSGAKRQRLRKATVGRSPFLRSGRENQSLDCLATRRPCDA